MMNAKVGLTQIRKNWANWQWLAGLSTKRLAQKGHFVVYTIDERRFEIPLHYLNNRIVGMLIELSEEEFGYSVSGPITLPCDGDFMEYVMDLVRRRVSEEVEIAIVDLLLLPCNKDCSLPSKIGAFNQQLEVC